MEVVEQVLGVLTSTWLWIIASAALAVFAGKYKLKVKEARDVLVAYNEAIQPDSEGGDTVTASEREKIAKEVVDLLRALFGVRSE